MSLSRALPLPVCLWPPAARCTRLHWGPCCSFPPIVASNFQPHLRTFHFPSRPRHSSSAPPAQPSPSHLPPPRCCPTVVSLPDDASPLVHCTANSAFKVAPSPWLPFLHSGLLVRCLRSAPVCRRRRYLPAQLSLTTWTAEALHSTISTRFAHCHRKSHRDHQQHPQRRSQPGSAALQSCGSLDSLSLPSSPACRRQWHLSLAEEASAAAPRAPLPQPS